jgi:malate dehydrogenase
MAIKRRKISVVGGGFTGATTALMVAQKSWEMWFLLIFPTWKDQLKGKR